MGYGDELGEGRLEKNVFVIFGDEVREKWRPQQVSYYRSGGEKDLNSETVREV